MLGEIIGAIGNVVGGFMNSEASKENNAANIAMQREFAQNGISWKVEDAKRAGIHPLYALGAQTSSFSNVTGDTGMGDAVSKASQNLGRAVDSAQDKEDRDLERASKMLQIQKMGLENKVIEQSISASDLRLKNQAGSPPSMPLKGDAGNIIPGQPHKTVSGYPVKDDDIKQKAEDHPQTAIGRPYGYPLLHNPYFGDGQSFEDRYGDAEIPSTLKWGVNTIADHMYTGYKKWVQPAARDLWRRRHLTGQDISQMYTGRR